VIERAIILSERSTLRVPVGPVGGPVLDAPTTPADAERQHILEALHQTDGRVRGPDGATTRHPRYWSRSDISCVSRLSIA